MSKPPELPLVAAVLTLAADLQRFEAQSAELSRAPLNSEKALRRALSGLEACSEHGTKLAESLRGFAQAMQQMQELQQHCMELTAATTQRIAERKQQHAALQSRLALLGQNARAASAPLGELPGSDETVSNDALAPLQEVEQRLGAVIAEAAEVSEIARRDDWDDVLRDTQSLQQQLQAVRNRVLLLRRKLATDAPS
jgi:DNA repair exonuclease SbcCD ATPase subunit